MMSGRHAKVPVYGLGTTRVAMLLATLAVGAVGAVAVSADAARTVGPQRVPVVLMDSAGADVPGGVVTASVEDTGPE